MFKREGIWTRFNGEKVRRMLREKCDRVLYVCQPPGKVRLFSESVKVFDLLLEGMPKQLRGRAYEEIKDEEYGPASELLPALLDGGILQEDLTFGFSVLGLSLASAWSLGEVHTPLRGYLITNDGGDLSAEDARLLLGAWEPAANSVARRRCIARCYADHADSFGFPPFAGNSVGGDPELLMECIQELVSGSPGILERICRQTLLQNPLTSERRDYVRQLSGISGRRIDELFAEAGFKSILAKAGNADACEMQNREDEEVLAEAEDCIDIITPAAAFDPETARFVLANYCYFLMFDPHGIELS